MTTEVKWLEHDKERQKQYLSLLEGRVLSRQEQIHRMYVLDRIMMAEQGQQRFGTQYEYTEDQIKLKPIESIPFADQARLKLGLLTIAHYETILTLKRYNN